MTPVQECNLEGWCDGNTKITKVPNNLTELSQGDLARILSTIFVPLILNMGVLV